MEFDATVIQVRGLASYKTRFNPPFSTFEMPVPSQEYDSSCPFDFYAFCYLILPCDYGLSGLIFL